MDALTEEISQTQDDELGQLFRMTRTAAVLLSHEGKQIPGAGCRG